MARKDIGVLFELSSLSTYRRRAGLLIGAGLGVVYGLVTQSINPLAMPGIPLEQPPFGPLLNVALATCIGALLGWLTARPAGSIEGALLGSAVGAVIVMIATLISGRDHFSTGQVLVVIFLFLPVVAVLVGVIGVFRWLLNKTVEDLPYPAYKNQRRVRIFTLFLLVAWLGSNTLYTVDAQAVTRRMQVLIQAGQISTAGQAFPAEWEPVGQARFLRQAHGSYTLRWESQNLNRFGIARAGAGSWEESAAIARFETGWLLVCIFPTPTKFPECADFEP